MTTQATLPVLLALACLTADAGAASRTVVVQPIQVCKSDGSACPAVDVFEEETDKIYAQADIDVAFLPVVQVFSTTYWDLADVAEFNALCASGLGQHSDPTVVNCYFVQDLGTALPGTQWGVAGNGGNCFAINSKDAVLPTTTFPGGHVSALAHELGHCLGLGHCCDAGANPTGCPTGLMGQFSCSSKPTTIANITPDGAGLSTLSSAEISTILSSPWVRNVWTDLGFAKWGTQFQPELTGSGALVPGTTVTMSITGAPSGAVALLVVGLSPINAPLLGGTLVPSPDLTILFPAIPGGSLTLSTAWPAGAGGASLYHQFWFAAGSQTLASNAVRSDVPNL